MSIEMVFPIPVLLDRFHRPLTSTELEFAKNVALRKNVSNYSSTETYVLKNPVFHDLGAWLESKAKNFFNEIF